MAKKGYSLDKGFLFSKSWEPVFRRLTPEQFHRLFWVLYDYQINWGEDIYDDLRDDVELWSIASLLVHQIRYRLAGAKRKMEESEETEDPFM